MRALLKEIINLNLVQSFIYSFILDHIEDKEKRTKIHQLFKTRLTDFETHTQVKGINCIKLN